MEHQVLTRRSLSLSCRLIPVLFAAAILLVAPLRAQAQQPLVAGQNVNMVGGPWSFDPATGRIVGDPFLQRQNEPSIALSSRNPCHILAGANDYRAVDVPGLAGDQETGDAWLGLLKSIDCGQTWKSTLLPGYPQDRSAEGLASPVKGLAAGADATVRSAPGGLFYYSGMAFDRGAKNIGKVFVSTFLDNNNKEQGDPVQYVRTVVVDTGTSGQFLDKPWIAADIPRSSATCTVNGQTIPAAPVYITYTSFVGTTNNPHSKIMFSRSTNCGATWSNPSKLSESYALNQGTVLAVSPADGSIVIAWREFADPASTTALGGILFTRSVDGGKSFSKTVAIDAALRPFDQGSSGVSFRTNAYPSLAVDGNGRIYVAWAARGFAISRPDPIEGDARIVMSVSDDGGASWSMPRSIVDNYPGPGHQFMPALTFSAGKLVIAYYDLRDDISLVFGKYVNEAEVSFGSGKRHTLELRAAMAEPSLAPQFTSYTTIAGAGAEVPSTQVSQYLFGNYTTASGGSYQGARLQYNPPNLPIFAKGTVPFIGDYIDIAGQTFVLDANRTWQFNTQADASGRRVPLFHVAWTDNRDVRRPPAGQTWANYKSPTLGPSGTTCDPGSNPGSRNQNVYTAPLMPGLVVTAPGNQKSLGQIQRAFVVYIRNTTYADHYYNLTIGQPAAGAFASFTKIDETALPDPSVKTTLGPIFIPRRSSIARSVFIVSPGVAYPLVAVNVSELTATGGVQAMAAVVLNADLLNPDIANPDIANPDIANPDIANTEVYNPDIANVMVDNPDIANPDIANPDIANPDIANPDIANKTVANPDIANPDIANPDIANPDIANPDIANPDIANPDIANYSVTDVTWTVKNKGNTTAAYAFRAKLARSLPAGAKLQLIVRRVYIAPQANPENACAPPIPAIQNQVLVNIPNPTLSSSLTASFDPAAYEDNASFYLLPSDEGRVTLRLYCPKSMAGCPTTLSDARSLAAARIEAQAPNNCPPGSTEANCQVNGYRPDDIYDTVPPVTSCSITADGRTQDCGQGTFYAKGPALVTLTPADGIGVKTTECTLDGAPCVGTTFTISTEGLHQFSFRSTDFSGNAEALREVSVQIDTTAPSVTGFSFPPAASVPGQWLSAPSVTGTVNVVDGSPVTVTCGDSLSGTTVSANGTITVSGDGSHVLSCTVADSAGNATTAGTTINLDATKPTVTAPAVAVTGEAAGPGGAAVNYVVTGNDALSGATVVCTPPAGSNFALGDTLVSCTATDGAGNTATVGFTVVVRDSTPPVVTVSGSLVGEAISPAGGPVTFTASALDLVDGALAASCSPGPGGIFPIGSSTVNCVAIDRSGNTGHLNVVVVVLDTTAPVVTVPGAITADATGPSGGAASFTATASDAVSGSLLATCTPASGSVFPIGTTSVACSAKDAAGNTGSASFIVTVRDAAPPAVSVPAPIIAEAAGPGGATVSFTATAADAVSGAQTTFCTPASGSLFPLGTTLVTCSATDPAGNKGSASFTVTVSDRTAPSVTVPSPITAEAAGSAGATVSFTATAVDAVSSGLAATCTPASGSTFAIGTTSVSCTATDANGNTGSASFTVTVLDTTAPVVTVPSSITAAAAGPAGVTVTFSALATDSVSGSLATACAPASGSLFPLGTTSVTCSATDAKGNTGSSVFTVTVRDMTAPAVSVPGSIVAEAAGPGGANVAFSASATDAVSGGLSATCAPASGSLFPLGATTVSCSATDPAGNTGSNSFTVTVRDTTAPTLTLPAPITVAATSASGATVTFTATATDKVGGAITPVCAPASGTVFAIGTRTVACTATDAAGNVASGTFTVTVQQQQYGFINVKNLPPPAGTKLNLGSSVPLSWRWTLGGVAVDTADARPLITITGPTGITTTFTPESPGNSTFQYTSSSFTWQFNWQTKGLVAGTYSVSVTSRKTGQTSSGGQVTLK